LKEGKAFSDGFGRGGRPETRKEGMGMKIKIVRDPERIDG